MNYYYYHVVQRQMEIYLCSCTLDLSEAEKLMWLSSFPLSVTGFGQVASFHKRDAAVVIAGESELTHMKNWSRGVVFPW